MNRNLSVLILISFSLSAAGQNVFTLEDIIARSKGQSPASKQAETRKENRYWQYRLYKSNFNPQLRLGGNLPSYYKQVSQIQQPDGTFNYSLVQQTNNSLNIGLEQPIQWTGGTISANTGLNYFHDFIAADSARGQEWSGNVMNVRLTQPIFAYNQLRWDK